MSANKSRVTSSAPLPSAANMPQIMKLLHGQREKKNLASVFGLFVGVFFFTLDALVSPMTAATRAQGPFTSTQAGYRAAVIQEVSASREGVSEENKPS